MDHITQTGHAECRWRVVTRWLWNCDALTRYLHTSLLHLHIGLFCVCIQVSFVHENSDALTRFVLALHWSFLRIYTRLFCMYIYIAMKQWCTYKV